MSRIKACFAQLATRGRTALIPFVTAGDPEPEFTVPLMHSMVEAGADIIELGVPFSDPMADGPVIQRASERALRRHVNLRRVIEIVAEFRERDAATPVVLMGYLNPVECFGYEAFAEAAADAGVDGVLTVDLPPEEAESLRSVLVEKQIDPIFLLAPNSTEERIQRVSAAAAGYLYYVSLKGVTGAASLDLGDVEKKIFQIKEQSSLPVGVGFGIKTPETAAAVAAFSDAVVVGSALVEKIETNSGQPDVMRNKIVGLLWSMRTAMDAPKIA